MGYSGLYEFVTRCSYFLDIYKKRKDFAGKNSLSDSAFELQKAEERPPTPKIVKKTPPPPQPVRSQPKRSQLKAMSPKKSIQRSRVFTAFD